jgi:hypothetical protein
LITAETVVQPVNQSVIFQKARDVISSTGTWKIAIDVTLMPYKDATSIIKGDLLEIRRHKQEFTSISELSQIETLVVTLESKLQAFKQILPKPDSRRGLLNIGGSVLKALFGTAVISDVLFMQEFKYLFLNCALYFTLYL